jgi:hypothetical protein
MTNTEPLYIRYVRTEFTHSMDEVDRLQTEIRDKFDILDDLPRIPKTP